MQPQRTFQHIIANRDLRRRILISIGLLVIFRIISHIPLPSVDVSGLRAFFESNQGIGLESVINILGKLGGEYELSSGDSFRLREEDSKGMKRKTYGIITPEQHVPPLPSFYFKASIPIKE